MTDILEIAKGYEKALFAGDWERLKGFFTEDAVYEIAGEAPIGGVFRGRDAIINSFRNREFGLGTGFEYGPSEKQWYADNYNNKVMVEIHEKTWLPNARDDVLDIWTLAVLTFRGDKISHMREYTDTEAYFKFKERHPELERFRGEKKRRLSVVSVPAKDMNKTRAFFKNMLGLDAKIEGPEWTEFLLDNSVIAIHPVKENDKVGFALEVNNIEDFLKQLKKAGVEFVQELKEEEWGKLAIIKDPDGVEIEIVQY